MNKRDAIIKAATKLFAVKGFNGTSVRKIAEEVALSVPGMFHYFPSKEEILNEIVIKFMDDGYNQLMDIYNSDRTPIEKVEDVCKFYAEYYAGNKDLLTILLTEGKSLSLEHRLIFIEKQRIYVKALKQLFTDLMDKGLIKSINPSVLTFMLFGMVHYTHKWYSTSKEISPDKLGKIFSELFLRGLIKDNK
ncbi:MAG: TetR/AcrR family transcriptional regulator [Spirochaetota bacterium]